MAVIVLASASGSPGVTTTALGLALSWPRPVLLVEADPTGGSGVLAGYLRGSYEHPGGLIELALAHRQDSLTALGDVLPHLVMQIPDTTVGFLAGPRSHGQARSLHTVWAPLAEVLQGLDGNGQDVIVDVGRLGLVGSPEPLIYAADLALLLTRTTLPALAGARSWAETLGTGFAHAGAASHLGVVLVGDRQPYGAAEVAKVLGLSVLSSLAWDPQPAAVFSQGASVPRRFDTSPLLRSLQATVSSIQSVLAANAADLVAATSRAQP